VNSARVTGGVPPSIQLSVPPQSPVAHFVPTVVLLEKEQPVRAQNRPDQPGGAENVIVAWGASSNPPPPSTATPLPDNVPGQILLRQLFLSVKVVLLPADIAPGADSQRIVPVVV
jgi:hypothetical protein